MGESLREMAIKIMQQENKNITETDNALIVLGSANSGKSSLIAQWLNHSTISSNKKPTGLEYSWTRKSNILCHIWKLPDVSNDTSEKLISTVLRSSRKLIPSVILMVDLGKPKNIWKTIEKAITLLNKFSPIPIAIVGGRYDIFQNLEPETKKKVCKCLRSVALIISATIVFYSSEMPLLIKKTSDVLNSLTYGTTLSKSSVTKDHMTPLYIPKGVDTWTDISATELSLDQVGKIFGSQL